MLPKITSHRGYSEHFPENTLIAFKEAIRTGADRIELDVHFSKDERLVVHHDYDLATPSGGKGLISECTSDYIRSLDGGSWFDDKFKNEKIPFLYEVFEEFNDRIEYEIELKGFTKNFILAVIALADDYNLLKKIEFTSPHPHILSYIKYNYPNIKVGTFVDTPPQWMNALLAKKIILEQAHLTKIDVLHLPQTLVTRDLVEMAHKEKFLVHAANCDKIKEIKNAIDLEVDQLSTNALILALGIKKNYEK